MKLYYAPSVCSLAVRIILHELKMPFEYESVNLKSKLTERGEDYLKINPKGSVPALQLNNAEVLTENAIILQYLVDAANATHLLAPISDFKRYRTLEWLNYVSTDLHRYCAPLFWSKIPDDSKENFFKPALEKRLLFVNKHLQTNHFLMGENLTIADSYLFVIFIWLEKLHYNMLELPHFLGFGARMKSQESVKKSLQEEGLY